MSLDVLVVVNIKSFWWYFRSVLLQPSEAPGEHGLREFTSEGNHQSAASQTDSHLAKSHHLWVQGKTPFFQDKCILVPWHILGKSVTQNKWTKNQDFEMGPSVKFILSYTGYISAKKWWNKFWGKTIPGKRPDFQPFLCYTLPRFQVRVTAPLHHFDTDLKRNQWAR